MKNIKYTKKEIYILKQLFDEHWKQMFIKAFTFLKDDDQASKIIESIFLELLNSGVLEEDRNWETYLAELLKNKILKAIYESDVSEEKIKAFTKHIESTKIDAFNEGLQFSISKG